MTSTFGRVVGWAACVAAVALLGAALLLSTTAQAAEAQRIAAVSDGVRITGASVRLPAVAGRPAAGYFTLSGGGKGATLVGVASAQADRIEMHSSSMAGGIMRMDALPSVKVLPGKTVSFAPGGNHLMIFGVSSSLKPGATMRLTFRLGDKQTVDVDAVTVAAGAAPATIMGHGVHR